mmetsp:Transcript_5443/g.10019  ORF Transcript_5443/g.10019 Transcript_5443/m.10019 type:complete len:163 (-) Transcript_5443:432-920(-)|eukprot:CAMPEP_0197521024 /NCGR_PEP_ID=MMETSP1318-20131121/6331_1 /TAXON_ID=552666 /ORGANISM="Partenskyella glossopodia, Strain RCC365" /LENGTH=162 /DNA_ID=CAMNT_0043072829 /DNA_START=41 /DNA_END=529 /DNA_ORIENTATION=+
MEPEDLSKYVDVKRVAAMNSSGEPGSIFGGIGTLVSDTDEQMLLVIPFLEKVKIRSVAVTAAECKGEDIGAPKVVKLFKNAPNMDFADAEDTDPTAELDLSKEDVKKGDQQKLKFTSFQSVSSMTVFIESNHGDEDKSFLNNLTFYGRPIAGTNMNDLKASG